MKAVTHPSQKTLMGITVVLAALSVLPFLSQYGVAGPHEEGLMTSPAWRVFEGEVPYRDFSTRPTPGTYYMLAFLFSTVSATVTAARLLVVLLSVTVSLCLQRIGSRFLKGWWSLLPVVLFVCTGITHFPVVNHHWVGTAGLFLGILCLVRWDEDPTRLRAAHLGAAVALCWWILQLDGGVLGLTVLLYAFVFRPPDWMRNLAVMALSFVGASLLLWSPVLVSAGFQNTFEASVLEPLQFHVAWNEVGYSWDPLRSSWGAFQGGLNRFAFSWPAVAWLGHSLSYLLVWFVKYGLYYAVLGGSVLAVAYRKGRVPRPLLFVLTAVGLSTLIQSRQDMLYINYMNTGWYLLLGWLLWEFFPFRAAFAGVVGSIFVVQYGFGFRDSLEYRYPITTFRGTYYSKNLQEAQFYQTFYNNARALTPPGSYTLAYPYYPSFYFLTGTRNLSRPPVVLPIAYPDDVLTEDIVPRLAETKPTFIYRVPLTQESMRDIPNVDPEEFFAALARWDQQILADYEIFKDLNVIQIYKRKAEAGSKGQ